MFAFVPAAAVAARSSFAGSATRVSPRTAPAARWTMVKSKSVPFLDAPPALATAEVAAGVQFDPLGFTNKYDLDFLTEAEIKHGRICMLAMAGWVFPEAVAHLPGEAYSQTNPLAAVGSVGFLPMAQIFLLCMVCEAISFNGKARNNYENPGDYGWDAFGLMKNGGAKNHYRVAEIKNGRLAMCAIGGAIHHTLITNQGLLEQINAGNWLGGTRPF